MHRIPWFFHPISVFVMSILALGLSLFLYIYWYIEVSAGLELVVRRFNLDKGQVLASQTWMVILIMSLLVGIILMGILTIFFFNQKTFQLYRQQNNFINNFTHELKTPVTSLKLFLETFLKHDLSRDDRKKYLTFMVDDVERLSSTINRILDLARIESKSYVGDFSVKDLVEAVETIQQRQHGPLSGCDIEMIHPGKARFFARIEPELFEMLVMNVLTNAVKYNRSDRPIIKIRFEHRNRRLAIHFEDNGIGLERSARRKIFKKFYQFGKADDMSARGTGLGLYLSQCIARMHRGRISADSDGPGCGTTFTLTLPPVNPAGEASVKPT